MKTILCGMAAACLIILGASCGSTEAVGGGNTFDTENFIANYNYAAAQSEATQIAANKVQPMTAGNSAGTSGVEGGLMVDNALDSGALMIEPERIWVAGRPTDPQLLLSEYQALIMAASGLTEEEAKTVLDGLLENAFFEGDAEIESTVQIGGYTYDFYMTHGDIFSLTILPAQA